MRLIACESTDVAEIGLSVPAAFFFLHDPERMRIVDRILLWEVIAKLPDGYREAVILHDIEGLGHKEIGEMKGRSEGTSKSQLHKEPAVT
jgi:DNA-directed RNA polymerase specialized sigma24 family protein